MTQKEWVHTSDVASVWVILYTSSSVNSVNSAQDFRSHHRMDDEQRSRSSVDCFGFASFSNRPRARRMTPLDAISHAPHRNAMEVLRHLNTDQRRCIRLNTVMRDRVLPLYPGKLSKWLDALPEAEIAKHFHLSQRDAARVFNVGTSTFKRICKIRGIEWPTRVESATRSMSFETGMDISHAPTGLSSSAVDRLPSRQLTSKIRSRL